MGATLRRNSLYPNTPDRRKRRQNQLNSSWTIPGIPLTSWRIRGRLEACLIQLITRTSLSSTVQVPTVYSIYSLITSIALITVTYFKWFNCMVYFILPQYLESKKSRVWPKLKVLLCIQNLTPVIELTIIESDHLKNIAYQYVFLFIFRLPTSTYHYF